MSRINTFPSIEASPAAAQPLLEGAKKATGLAYPTCSASSPTARQHSKAILA